MSEEVVIIVDREDNELGPYPRSQVRKEKKIHRGSYIYICDNECKNRYLDNFYVQKRATNKSWCPGYWDLSTGGVV